MPPGALRRERDHFGEQLAQVGVFVAGGIAVALAEGGEPLDLDPLAGVVLPDELARGEADALVAAEQRFGRPPVAVAFERQEQRGQREGMISPAAAIAFSSAARLRVRSRECRSAAE